MLIQIHRINASISLFPALCLNAILILLVVKRSPKEMKVYKRILLQTSIVNIVLSVLCFLSQDITLSTNGWTTSLSVSQFSDYFSLSAQFKELLIHIWLIAHFCSMFGLCVQFVYRFLVLNSLLFTQMCVTLPLHWLPVLNPLVSILCVSDYRKALANFIRIKMRNFLLLRHNCTAGTIPAAIYLKMPSKCWCGDIGIALVAIVTGRLRFAVLSELTLGK
ncbi:hypothetical protein niasHS_008353 [Heterodera schachtii]|uniref:Uncharacterized protein n=1 Tax=Heterodera schachtii TaxID=97005 RepID=A0ABD2JCQ4_HETSC